MLHGLKEGGVIAGFHQNDRDDQPDFVIDFKNREFRMECKNVRSGPKQIWARGHHQGCYKVEIQKTRSGVDRRTGGPTRGYSADRFDILAACLFNQTGRWEYLFALCFDLARRDEAPDLLKVFQPVPQKANATWSDDLAQILRSAAGRGSPAF